MKKIALLGATGYIGKSLVPEFLAQGNEYELFLFSRSKDKLQGLFETMDSSHMYDLQDFPLHEYDSIINCTGIGETSTLKEKPGDIFKVTEDMDLMIIAYLEKHPKVLYINLSSGAVYGDNFKRSVKVDTKSIININSLSIPEYYAIAKINAEAKHRALSQFNIVDIRIFAFFSQFVDSKSSFLMSEIVRCLKNKESFETTDENIKRDYICPKDLFLLISLIIKKKKMNEAIDAYSLRPVTKFKLLSFLEKRYGLHSMINKSSKENLSFKKVYCSNNKKAEKVGYVPKFSSLEGIKMELEKMREKSFFK